MSDLLDCLTSTTTALRKYADQLLVGITPEVFARKPSSAGRVVDMNHPAFLYGHLALYPTLAAEVSGLDPSLFQVVNSFEPLFKKGAICHDDPDGLLYPQMDSIVSQFRRSWDALLEAVPSIDPEILSRPLEDQQRSARFPTNGSFFLYIMGPHQSLHLGQVSCWRRCFGLGSVG